jgi:hypothetical protein
VLYLDVAKDVWSTLRNAHEGSKPVRKAKIEMLEGQLNRFIMYDDETPHEIFNWLKKLVNKARALGSKKWTDHILTERLMMTYTLMNYNVVTERLMMTYTFKKQTTLRIFTRVSQHPRSKTLLSKQRRAKRRKL